VLRHNSFFCHPFSVHLIPPERPVIRVAAALIIDAEGRLLLVRKRGTAMFMQPGGKIEVGETPASALARELREEVGLDLDSSTFEYLGRFATDAANEAGHALDAEMFAVSSTSPPIAAAEIAELAWIHPQDMHGLPIAPLVHDHALRFVVSE